MQNLRLSPPADTIGDAAYLSRYLERSIDGYYEAQVEVPARGWRAFFVELTYASATDVPFKFTTEVRVVPDELPFENPLAE